jgi:hypothetical protein
MGVIDMRKLAAHVLQFGFGVKSPEQFMMAPQPAGAPMGAPEGGMPPEGVPQGMPLPPQPELGAETGQPPTI